MGIGGRIQRRWRGAEPVLPDPVPAGLQREVRARVAAPLDRHRGPGRPPQGRHPVRLDRGLHRRAARRPLPRPAGSRGRERRRDRRRTRSNTSNEGSRKPGRPTYCSSPCRSCWPSRNTSPRRWPSAWCAATPRTTRSGSYGATSTRAWRGCWWHVRGPLPALLRPDAREQVNRSIRLNQVCGSVGQVVLDRLTRPTRPDLIDSDQTRPDSRQTRPPPIDLLRSPCRWSGLLAIRARRTRWLPWWPTRWCSPTSCDWRRRKNAAIWQALQPRWYVLMGRVGLGSPGCSSRRHSGADADSAEGLGDVRRGDDVHLFRLRGAPVAGRSAGGSTPTACWSEQGFVPYHQIGGIAGGRASPYAAADFAVPAAGPAAAVPAKLLRGGAALLHG